MSIQCVHGLAINPPSYPSPPCLEWRPVELQFWSFPTAKPLKPCSAAVGGNQLQLPFGLNQLHQWPHLDSLSTLCVLAEPLPPPRHR